MNNAAWVKELGMRLIKSVEITIGVPIVINDETKPIKKYKPTIDQILPTIQNCYKNKKKELHVKKYKSSLKDFKNMLYCFFQHDQTIIIKYISFYRRYKFLRRSNNHNKTCDIMFESFNNTDHEIDNIYQYYESVTNRAYKLKCNKSIMKLDTDLLVYYKYYKKFKNLDNYDNLSMNSIYTQIDKNGSYKIIDYEKKQDGYKQESIDKISSYYLYMWRELIGAKSYN